jgi:hypothetical protein
VSHPISQILSIAVLIALSSPLAAQESSRTQVGMLRCRTSASLGLVVGSHQKITCRFDSSSGAPSEGYTGYINRLGLDLGVVGGGLLSWAVFAPSQAVQHGALAGKYVGASGEASLVVGVGANALLGGSKRSVALQPVSVEGQIGVNLALGVAGLTLRSVQ